MNNDLISREAAIDALHTLSMYYGPYAEKALKEGGEKLKRLPAVDAVGVVRCKDCVYRGNLDICPMTYEYPTDHAFDMTDNDDFCSKGKKIDEEV